MGARTEVCMSVGVGVRGRGKEVVGVRARVGLGLGLGFDGLVARRPVSLARAAASRIDARAGAQHLVRGVCGKGCKQLGVVRCDEG